MATFLKIVINRKKQITLETRKQNLECQTQIVFFLGRRLPLVLFQSQTNGRLLINRPISRCQKCYAKVDSVFVHISHLHLAMVVCRKTKNNIKMPGFLTRVVNRKVCIMRIIACVMMKCQSFQLLTYQEPLKHLIFNLKYNRRVLLLFKSCWPKAFYFSVCGFACKNAQKNCFQREVQITTFKAL